VLETEQARYAQDPEVLTRIGIRFYEGQAYQRASDVLAAALVLLPAFTTAVYHGLSQEALCRFGEAERSYHIAGSLEITPNQREELDHRIASLSRARLLAEARQAIAGAALTSPPPVLNTAVMPWLCRSRPTLEPLAMVCPPRRYRSFNHQSPTLVERERVQALLDEMALAGEGRVTRVLQLEPAGCSGLACPPRVVRETADGVRLEATIVRLDGADPGVRRG
jgi:hypothetical protein